MGEEKHDQSQGKLEIQGNAEKVETREGETNVNNVTLGKRQYLGGEGCLKKRT